MDIYNQIARKRKRKRIFLRVFFTLIILIPIIFFYNKKVLKGIVTYSQESIASQTKNSINSAIKFCLTDVEYLDLVNLQKDSQGNVSYLTINSLKINQLSKNVVEYSKIIIDEQLKKGVNIPILTFTGITFLSGYGKEVNYKILSIGSVTSDFLSEFTSQGINQTKHSIYVNVNVEVKLILPFSNEKIVIDDKILITESILLGKVPEIYFN